MNLYGEVGSIYHEWKFLIMSHFEDGFTGEEHGTLCSAEFFRINQHRPGIERDSGVVRQYDFAGFAVARRDFAQLRACFGNRLVVSDSFSGNVSAKCRSHSFRMSLSVMICVLSGGQNIYKTTKPRFAPNGNFDFLKFIVGAAFRGILLYLCGGGQMESKP